MSIVSQLSEALFISEAEIIAFLNTAPYRYKEYEILKRDGKKKRTIAQPTSELKTMQSFVVEKLQKNLPVHSAAMAYRRGVGIKQNANIHSKNEYLLKMDFKDFFHSIKPNDFYRHYKLHCGALAPQEAITFSKLFFWKKKGDPSLKLSIGAPSSPFLSNTLMYSFDVMLAEVCAKSGVTYTRYADDLTLTTNTKNVLFSFPEIVDDICRKIDYPSLTINKEKTVFSSRANNRHITGITINNDGRISLGRDRKRQIRSEIFNFLNGRLSLDEKSSLRGRLAFVRHTEPAFFLSLIKKYGGVEIAKIVKGSVSDENKPVEA